MLGSRSPTTPVLDRLKPTKAFRLNPRQCVDMPTYALANDNLMLCEPLAFRRADQTRVSPVTFCMLALARMLVPKIIAAETLPRPI